MNESRRAAALAPVLVLTTLVVSIISALGAPLIPTVAKDFHESLTTSQWSLTVALLSGSISAPVMGRLGDGPHRRVTMIGGLVAVTLGGMVAALATGFDALVVGRGLQGVGLGLIPLAMATARDEMRSDRVPGIIALLSVSAAAGIGAGYPLSGVIAEGLGLSGAFWFGTIVSAVGLLCVIAVVPSPRVAGTRRDGQTSNGIVSPHLDWGGTALLAAALVSVLLGVAQGESWGWGSPTILGLLGAGIILVAAWTLHQLRHHNPLVDLRLLRHPAVLAGDGCAMVLGIAMYMNLTAVTEFVQLPSSGGFGFSASVVVAGLILVPMSALMLSSSRALPALLRYLGVRAVLTVGCLVVGASSTFFAIFHGSLWEAFVMMGVLGIGLGVTFAAIPGLIVRAVPQHETGSAMGFYQVVRYVGFSLGSALTAAVLSSHLSSTSGQPALGGYTTVMWLAGGICVVAAVAAWVLPTRGQDVPADERLDEREIRVLEQTEGEDLLEGAG